jgi:hypothetical protein
MKRVHTEASIDLRTEHSHTGTHRQRRERTSFRLFRAMNPRHEGDPGEVNETRKEIKVLKKYIQRIYPEYPKKH